MSDVADHTRAGRGAPTWVIALDVATKVLLVLAMVRVALDPSWGHLEGKAPGTRALSYPVLAFVVPLARLRFAAGPYPWLADLLLTIPASSDVLGNRLDLYDQVSWFDDFVHFVNTGALSAAVVLLVGAGHLPLVRRTVLAIAAGMTLALAWEVWEYLAFVARSGEAGTAYADTVWDLALGWCGAVVAAVLLGARGDHRSSLGWRHDPLQHSESLSSRTAGRR